MRFSKTHKSREQTGIHQSPWRGQLCVKRYPAKKTAYVGIWMLVSTVIYGGITIKGTVHMQIETRLPQIWRISFYTQL